MEIDTSRSDRHVASSEDFYPRGCVAGPSHLHAECLVSGIEPSIGVTVNFAQAVERRLLDAAGEPVAELLVTGRQHRCGEESVEHEVRLEALPDRTAVVMPAGSERAELKADGIPAGTLVWCWEPLHATVEAWIDPIRRGLHRVRIDIANRLEAAGLDREQAGRRAVRSPHITVRSLDGAFASPISLELPL